MRFPAIFVVSWMKFIDAVCPAPGFPVSPTCRVAGHLHGTRAVRAHAGLNTTGFGGVCSLGNIRVEQITLTTESLLKCQGAEEREFCLPLGCSFK